MARNKRTAACGKVTAAHCSMIDAAQPVVKAAQRHPEVTKIHLGRIEHTKKGNTLHIKFHPLDAGMRVMVRGSVYIQEILIYCVADARDRIQVALEAAFN